ncbi:PIN+ prion protein RNQ1 [Drosophila pseudoobscura]|uniref:PIN+ prion protein RNQ1 n=1 Tax=Drosophila pseudoobscura pseudoobscura TaxID=46245 RepID=A0A6I8UN21_DROPS|nr:PIN+ prion protein RNQ1 [Drosophila pseudoobscura]
MPLIAAAATTILTIVGATAMARSPASYGNNVASLYDNRWHRHGAGERRSHQGAVLNGLTNLSGLGHISNGYDSVAPTKQETPIYEEHNEDAAVAAVAATAHDQHQHQPHYLAGGGGGGFLPAFGGYGSWGLSSPEEQQPYAYEKISMGNFLPHSGYEGHQQEQVYQRQEQAYQQQEANYQKQEANYQQQEAHYQQRQEAHYQQQRQGEQQHSTYFSPHGETSASGSATSGSAADDYEEHPGDGQEQSSNYLAESPSGHSQHSHHVDIINYVPVKHVKQQHVPVEKPVKIPISHAVIIPVRRPVPIHIPITKTIQVPVEKELKVPVERVVGVPVEKHIPVPVEKHVPYEVIKYVPIKVPKPFPVKVPVFKTVLHKVKSWW